MIPSKNTLLSQALSVEVLPSLQHKMELAGERIRGFVDEREAIRQTIYKILNTERYRYIIYSWDYGIQLEDLFGQAPLYVCPELERRITEALCQDDRIQGCEDFDFDLSRKGTVAVTFTAKTIFGDLTIPWEVQV